MDVAIREMESKEALSVWKLGVKTFHSMEGIFMSKPKSATVAVHQDKIVGGVIYQTYKYKDGMLGYIDYAFVDKHFQGQGIGSKLYEASIKKLYELGCTQVFGLVRGDNPGSFLLFEKQEINRCTLKSAYHVLGLSGWLRLMLGSILGWGPAMDCYLSNVPKKKDNIGQIFWYLFVNLAILLCGIFGYQQTLPMVLAAAATVMAAGVIFSASILLENPKSYHFRLSNGGYFITAIVALLGGIFPLRGTWYPEKFEHTKKQQRELCLAAVLEWLGVLALYVVTKESCPDNTYWSYVAYFSKAFTVFRMIPTFPFSEYGERRIYQCNKWLYAALWALSAAVLYFI